MKDTVKAKALLVDVGGTLDADGEHWRGRFYRLYSKYGYQIPEDIFDHAYFSADDCLAQDYPLHKMGLYQTVHALTDSISRRLHATSWITQQIADDFYFSAMRYYERNEKTMRDLKQRFRIALVSNYYGNLCNTLKETGLHECVDAVIDSDCVGARKPEPFIFQAALDAIGASPSQSLFVGDSYERDILGAQRIGIKPIWLVPARRACSHRRPDGVVYLTSFDRLSALLDQSQEEV